MELRSTYSRLRMTNADEPYDLMSFAVIWMPLERVCSATSRSPMSIGSMLGTSISGMPRTRNGRSVSMLCLMQSLITGSLRVHMCKYSAKQNKKENVVFQKHADIARRSASLVVRRTII